MAECSQEFKQMVVQFGAECYTDGQAEAFNGSEESNRTEAAILQYVAELEAKIEARPAPEAVAGLVSVFCYDEVLTFTFCDEDAADAFAARFDPSVDSAAPNFISMTEGMP